MYYIMIVAASIFFAIQFVMLKKYTKITENSWKYSLKFAFYTSLFGMILLFAANGFKLNVSLFSFALAFLFGANRVLLYYFSAKAFLYANLSIYSVASMIGALLLPYCFGLICGEKLTVTGLACCILIIIALLITINGGKSSKKAIIYYMGVFTANGLVGIISKWHQMYPAINVDSNSFMIITNIAILVISTVLILINKDFDFKLNFKANVYTFSYAGLNNFGNLFLLIALLHVPASVQYPIVSGGNIVFSLLISIALKEKNNLSNYISAIIAFVATVLLIF